jgi:hypothetical protein
MIPASLISPRAHVATPGVASEAAWAAIVAIWCGQHLPDRGQGGCVVAYGEGCACR